MIAYDFQTPAKIVFGWGRRAELGQLLRPLGQRAWIVWGSETVARQATDWLPAACATANIQAQELAFIRREPLVADVDQTVARYLAAGPRPGDFLLAIGGGSALDLAKAVAVVATQQGGPSVADFLEGVGRQLPITQPPLPVAALPTTAGTGSEATKNAVISSLTPPFKKSLRSESMFPRLVLVDPELTVSLPASITAQTGMDAITQLIESYISCRARPVPQALALAALPAALPALRRACRDGADRPAREALSQAALLSGMALANSGLGMAHGVAAALGVHCGLPHGLACALMLPATLQTNCAVAESALAELGRAIGCPSDSDPVAAHFLIEQIRHLCHDVGIPHRLRAAGVRREQLPDLVQGAHGNSLSGNPRPISDAELLQILESIW